MPNEDATEEQKARIDSMTQEEMAWLYRFAPVGHPFFKHDPVGDYFMRRFKLLGGMTPAISKRIGWD
jgi:hypothetical protein